MSQVKNMFAKLDPQQRESLMMAFNECRDQIIILEDGTFVGCNIECLDELEIDEKLDNGWVCGRLKDD